jgi:hypothetical protein
VGYKVTSRRLLSVDAENIESEMVACTGPGSCFIEMPCVGYCSGELEYIFAATAINSFGSSPITIKMPTDPSPPPPSPPLPEGSTPSPSPPPPSPSPPPPVDDDVRFSWQRSNEFLAVYRFLRSLFDLIFYIILFELGSYYPLFLQCAANDLSCASNADCCSGLCQFQGEARRLLSETEGTCVSCIQAWYTTCQSDSDCCDGLVCNEQNSYCGPPPSPPPPDCGATGTACSTDDDCCDSCIIPISRKLLNEASGTCGVVSASSCCVISELISSVCGEFFPG